VDIINQSRNYIVQRKLSVESTQGPRLTYVRWLTIVGLFIQNHLAGALTEKLAFTANSGDTILGSYIVLNLVIWLVTSTFAKNVKRVVPVTLAIDVVMTVLISWAAGSPIFFFALLPAFMIVLLVGVWEGVGAFVLVIGANIAYLFVNKPDTLKAQMLIVPQTLIFGALMLAVGLSAYIITQNASPLLKVQEQMLEEALARANEANLVELQNRAKAVYRVTNTLSATLDYENVIKAILEEMQTIFDVEVGMVLMFDQALSGMQMANAVGVSNEERKQPVSISSGIVKEILLKGTSILVSSKRDEDNKLGQLQEIFPSLAPCRSMLITPLRAGFEVFGFVLIASKEEFSYGSNDLELMATLTSHGVIAMQNARLYRNILDDRNKILTREEELRHELARNLHDGPAQAVAAFSMQSEFIKRLVKADPERAVEELAILGKQAQQTSKEIRTLLFGLRPLVLESQGLSAALEQFAGRFPMQPNDPSVHFSSTFEGRADIRVESTIFTILQEAVNNARKHAMAKNMWLHLEVKDGYLIASAQDDGRGFDLAAVEKNYETRGSLGLTNMKERSALVGGTTTMSSAPGKGTSVVIRVPLNQTGITQ
jgi:signal transduction histidine kinase